MIDILDFAANNAKSATDTVLLDDFTASNGLTTTDNLAPTDSPSTDTPARDTVAISDRALPDGSARDLVVLSDSPLVESFIFHPVFATDTVAIDDNTSPDSAVIDIVSVSDDSLAEAFVFHAVLANDVVSVVDTASLFSAVLDTVALTDVGSLFSSVLDTVAVSDSPLVESFVFYGISANDVVAIADAATLFSAVLDIVAVSESSFVQSNVFYDIVASDAVTISDTASLLIAALDVVSMVDTASLFNTVLDVVTLSDSVAVQSNIFYAIFASDTVTIADAATLFSAALDAVTIVDVASLASSVIDIVDIDDTVGQQLNHFYDIVASDVVSIFDAAATFGSLIDVVAITDAATLPVTSVTDVVDIAITTSLATVKSIVDQMAVADSFFDIAIAFSRIFSETLILPDCIFTNESGQCDTVGIVTIFIGDAVQLVLSSVNNPGDQLATQDQLARNLTSGRGSTDSMLARDSKTMSAASPPPLPPGAIAAMPPVIMTETETIGSTGLSEPAEAVEVAETWSISGFDDENLELMLAAIDMPIYNISSLAGSGGIDEMTMVMPAFMLSVEVDGILSNDGVFLTPTVSDMPEGMQVMIPIDVEESMGESLGPLGNMTLSFTPAVSGNNATMMIAMLDNNPEPDMTAERADGVAAFYIDVSLAGEFAGMDPSDEAFFEDGPRLTFTLTEEWALENDVRLPRISMYLLDETTGEWIELPISGLPDTSADGVYTYTVELPHLSTYVVTADRVRSGTDADEYVVSLSESLLVTGSASRGPAGSGEQVIKDLSESLSIGTTQPETKHQRVIALQNLTVAISVVDVRSAGPFGTAVAELIFEIANTGSTPEELAIRYWYANSDGTVYEGGRKITINAGESTIEEVLVPFSSAGTYNITIEAITQDQTLAATDIAIEVPWLAANLFQLVIIIAATVAASIAIVVYAIRPRIK